MTVTQMFEDKQIREALEYLMDRGITAADYALYLFSYAHMHKSDDERDQLLGDNSCEPTTGGYVVAQARPRSG